MRTYQPLIVSFYIRKNRNVRRDFSVYCCLKIRGQNSKEFCVERSIKKHDWDTRKGRPKCTTDYLLKLGLMFDSIKSKLLDIYLNLKLEDASIMVERIRDIYFGKESGSITLLELIDKAIVKYEKELAPGSMKNYGATKAYVEAFCRQQFKSGDIKLSQLNFSFIDKLKTYILSYPIKSNDPCTNNGCMKHMERIKKIIKWAYEMEYIDRNIFASFQIRKKRYESKVLTWNQIRALEKKKFSDYMLELVRDQFLFSCYTGMAPFDLQNLQPHQVYSDSNKVTWLTYTRGKSIIVANVPLLSPAIKILKKYEPAASSIERQTSFPKVTNKDLNTNLKMIGQICEIGIRLNFYIARHTFATTVTLEQGVPITTIKEMMGHEKIESTMNYAKISKSVIASDMKILQTKILNNTFSC